MLEALRSFVGSWVAKILLGLLVISFAVWGVSGSMLTGAASNAVVTVGETTVPVNEYIATYNRNVNALSRQVGRNLTQEQARLLGAEQRTLTDVVTSATLNEYADNLSLSLSQDRLNEMLRSNPAFQDSSGRFSADIFRRATFDAGIRQEDFVRLQNHNAVRSQIMEAVAAGPALPKAFASALARYAGEERVFSYITLTPEQADSISEPTDTQLQTYFDSNRQTYAAPEYRKLALLTLEPKDIADEATIADADVEAEYQARKAAFSTPELRRVQQLALPDTARADAAKAALASGDTFETVLSENNLTLSDADLGLVTRESLPADLRDAAFALPLNETSDIIQTAFGPRIIRVTEIRPGSTRPLSEVADEIRNDLALRLAADRVTAMQTEIEDIRAGGIPLDEAADRAGLKVRIVENVSRNAQAPDGSVISDLPNSRRLLEEAFQTEIGEQTSPLNFNDLGSLWYEVLDITPDRDRTLEEVRDQVVEDWKTAQRRDAVQAKAETLKERVEKGATLAAIAEDVGLEVATTKPLKRGETDDGFPEAATAAGFGGVEGHVAIAPAAENVDRILLVVDDVQAPEALAVDNYSNELERAELGAANDLLSQLISNLQARYSVNYNPELIRQALARQ